MMAVFISSQRIEALVARKGGGGLDLLFKIF